MLRKRNPDQTTFDNYQKKAARYEKVRLRLHNEDRTHKNMYQEVYWHTLVEEGTAVVFILVLALIYLFLRMGDLDVSLKWRLYLCGGCAGLVIVVWLVSSWFAGASARLRREIRNNGLDEREIERDFMRSITYHAMFGIIGIGNQYTVYASRREAFVLPNEAIHSVKRVNRTNVYRVNRWNEMKSSHYGIVIHTDQGGRQIWSDEIGTDLILDEFHRRGML